MKVLVCLISSQDNIVETIERLRERLIPQDLFKKKKGPDYPVHFKISVFNPLKKGQDFDKFLLHAVKGMDAVIVLVENCHANLLGAVANAVFGATFETHHERISNFNNFFKSYFSKLFWNFFQIKNLMGKAENEQAMMLPLRNFQAKDLVEMARLVREESRSPTFVSDMKAQLAAILKRRLRRKRSDRNTKYFIDDKGMHFVYGNEKHARYDTGNPHVAACEINGLFRFGKSIDTSRHYNASFGDGDDTNISGDFPDCHDGIKTVPKSPSLTHVNMFSNDFC